MEQLHHRVAHAVNRDPAFASVDFVPREDVDLLAAGRRLAATTADFDPDPGRLLIHAKARPVLRDRLPGRQSQAKAPSARPRRRGRR
jgi:hypothetical protein